MDPFSTTDELGKIFSLRKKIGKLPLSKILESSCGHKLIPVDHDNHQDIFLLKHLTSSLNKFLSLTKKSGARFHGNRINDIGKKIENQIEEEIRKTPLEIIKLGSSGYPDFEIKQNGRVTYLELKTTGNIDKKSTHHRMFYFSSGKKIKKDGRHLLLQIQMEQEERGYWKIISWQLRDLSGLKLGLKTEFNANFQDFDQTPLLSKG